MPRELPLPRLQYYQTAPYPCNYLEGQIAQSEVASPPYFVNDSNYTKLVQAGFRRSGIFTYRPRCPNCQACVPVRIPVNQFHPNRSQKRAWNANQHMVARMAPLGFNQRHYDLYKRYQDARHYGGGMDDDNEEQYNQFLIQSRVYTHLIEFIEPAISTKPESLIMVALTDILSDGLSSVYTFFNPELTKQSLGTFGILWQIEQTRQMELDYLYLGYWIKNSEKMAYKSRFLPLEYFVNNQWQTTQPQT